MAYQIEIKKSAAKEIAALPRADQERIRDKIDDLTNEPRPVGCEKLAGADDTYRVRVGTYRIIYTVDDGIVTVTIVRVGHRREVYR
jgi:mRNA interferase RelE/StbE